MESNESGKQPGRFANTILSLLLTSAIFVLSCISPAWAAERKLAPHPLAGKRLVPEDVDRERAIYETSFDDPARLRDWRLEGGKSMSVVNGKLVLESVEIEGPRGDNKNHLVCWLRKEVPGDFLLEFSVRPDDRKNGLNIVFFNARGISGENIFEPSLQPRDGTFKQYWGGDLKCYHVSYWAANPEGKPRGANVRKNPGKHLVAQGNDDPIENAPTDAFKTVRLYKHGGEIRLAVDGVIIVAYDDDGKTHGPVLSNTGWIGLRQMGRTLRCEYDHLTVYPLKPLVVRAND